MNYFKFNSNYKANTGSYNDENYKSLGNTPISRSNDQFTLSMSNMLVSQLETSSESTQSNSKIQSSSDSDLDTSSIFLNSCSSIENEDFDIEEIFQMRTKYSNNPIIGFLNINSVRNKIIDLRLIMERCLPDILVIEEMKLNADFKTETFQINNYQRPIRCDRNKFGGEEWGSCNL